MDSELTQETWLAMSEAERDAMLGAELTEMRETTRRIRRLASSRPAPLKLSGCTCGGIGDTGSHRPGCAWAAR